VHLQIQSQTFLVSVDPTHVRLLTSIKRKGHFIVLVTYAYLLDDNGCQCIMEFIMEIEALAREG